MLLFLCAGVMSTQRADLDDKRVVLPCWVGHLKDSHFSGSSVERSMMEGEGWTGRLLWSVCAVQKKKRKYKQPVGTEHQRTQFSSASDMSTHLEHTHIHVLIQKITYMQMTCLHPHTWRQADANYRSLSATAPPHLGCTGTQKPHTALPLAALLC